MINKFDTQDLRNIAEVISQILSHSKITQYLHDCRIEEAGGCNKPDRVFNALNARQEQDRCGNNVAAFIMTVLSPKRYESELEFHNDRTRMNEKLAFAGYIVTEQGKLTECPKANTISEAQERSQKIKKRIQGLNIHPELISYCDEEWLRDDYFHAIEEVAKSVFDVLRRKVGNHSIDGCELVDYCFSIGNDKNPNPKLAFNMLNSKSEVSEHKGFANFCKGFYGMYRNPKAHAVRKNEEADLLSIIPCKRFNIL